MAYYKKVQQKINGLWYPQSVTMGEPITTEKIIERLSAISTVSKSDVRAVLGDLATVLADYMALGHTVKLDGADSNDLSMTSEGMRTIMVLRSTEHP